MSDWSSDVCSSDLAGPIACSSGKDKSSATYTLGTELGINKAAMDTGVKPGNDFYAYANGNWQKTTEIPADRASTGAFYTAFLETEKRNRELIEDRKSKRLNSSN